MASKRRAYYRPLTFAALATLALMCAAAPLVRCARAASFGQARVFVLMIWDGLRPDLVNARDTPNLFAISRAGTLFAHHHANFPTLTMVNAAVLATGAPPGVNGLLGNMVYFPPFLPPIPADRPLDEVRRAAAQPLFLEDSKLLARLNAAGELDGRLLTVESLGQALDRQGGYLAVIGKRGPTFLFDDRVGSPARRGDSSSRLHRDYLFVSSDLIEPDSMARMLVSQMPADNDGIALDAFMTRVALRWALPRATQAAAAGRAALVVLWQRNPDATQHRYGLGTAQAIQSLAAGDANLGALRRALGELGIESSTDLMVASDHGVATIAANVDLARALVEIGVKQSVDSDDVVVATNGGSDEIIVSRAKFPSATQRREMLRRIVGFAAPQPWCGPVFSRPPALEGTFDLRRLRLYDSDRSPDLIISFNELSETDNSSLTGPGNPGFVFDARGRHAAQNVSAKLIEPVKGVVYNDFGAYQFGTGLAMHGAAGLRELHNFAAAVGPDFRRGFIDQVPTGNSDVAPTIAAVLKVNFPPAQERDTEYGRVMREALAAGAGAPPPLRRYDLRTRLVVGQTVVTSVLHMSAAGGEDYLDASEVTRTAP